MAGSQPINADGDASDRAPILESIDPAGEGDGLDDRTHGLL